MAKKRLLINFIYQSAYQVLLVFLPLITAPYISRVLGNEGNGIYSYTFTISNYFVAFASLGIEAYGNRKIAHTKSQGREELNRVFSEILYLHLLIAGIVSTAYLIYAIYFVKDYKLIFILQSIWVFSSIFDINWFFFGMEEFKITVVRNAAIKLLTIILIFIFVKSASDLWIYTLIMSVGTFLSQTVVWMFLHQFVSFTKVPFTSCFKHFIPICALFVAVIATQIYRMIDKVMLGHQGDMGVLGAYEYADKLIKLCLTLIASFGTVMLPRMTALYAEKKDDVAKIYLNSTTQFVFVISVGIAFGLAGVAREFVPIFLGKGYEKTVEFLMILAISLPIMGWNNLIRSQILMPKEKDSVYIIAVCVGAIANVVLNIVLIKPFGGIGAAIATDVSYLLVGVFQSCPLQKDFKISQYMKHLMVPLVTGFVMFVFVRVIGELFGIHIMTLVVQIVSGAALYMILNVIYMIRSKNEVLMQYWIRIKSKLKNLRSDM